MQSGMKVLGPLLMLSISTHGLMSDLIPAASWCGWMLPCPLHCLVGFLGSLEQYQHLGFFAMRSTNYIEVVHRVVLHSIKL
jgi:hypothetical protein